MSIANSLLNEGAFVGRTARRDQIFSWMDEILMLMPHAAITAL